jgi:hypothetical protein
VSADQVDVVDWCVLQLGGCRKKAGMETFKDVETKGKITLIVGGKALVVDIELSMDRNDETRPKLFVVALRASYASPVNGRRRRPGFDGGLLMDHIQGFIGRSTSHWESRTRNRPGS